MEKKYVLSSDMLVYNSIEPTIECDPTDGYNGAHSYRIRLAKGFNPSKQQMEYSNKTQTIKFIMKTDKGTTEGLQSEQLALILLDRVKKLNAKYPSDSNEKQIAGLTMYLDACRERIDDRLARGVMGELKK